MSHRPAADTVEIPALCDKGCLPYSSESFAVPVEIAADSDKGRVRDNNEDHYLVARFDRTMRTLSTNLKPGVVPEECTESAYGMIVADGMGGHSAGEVASESAIVGLINLVLRTPDWIMSLDDQRVQQVLERMHNRLEQVNEMVADQAVNEPELSGMGTTMTLAASLGLDAIIAHVGDSRAYLMRQGQLSQLTRDHTVAQALVDIGLIDPGQATSHQRRHVLTNVIGGKGDKVRVELHHLRLQDGDQLLLCTDGLSDMAKEEAIAEVLARLEITSLGICVIGQRVGRALKVTPLDGRQEPHGERGLPGAALRLLADSSDPSRYPRRAGARYLFRHAAHIESFEDRLTSWHS